jgi:DNA modification methylase
MYEEFNIIVNNIKSNSINVKGILTELKKISKLFPNVKPDLLIELLKHPNKDVRLESVRQLGKFKNVQIEHILIEHYKIEINSIVKRECISSLGRQRNAQLLTFFFEVLSDKDPKIVLQAIRSLLIFKKNPEVIEALKKIGSHPNEMIKEVLNIELLEKNNCNKKKDVHIDNNKFKNIAVNADVIEVLKMIQEEVFHLTFTSPPYYNAKDYSFYNSYNEYLLFLKNVFKEVHRLTLDGRFLIVNTSPVIVPRVSRAHSSKRYPIPFDLHNILTQIGWEFIDDIIWLKPEASVKNRIGGFFQHRKPLGYKPNCITEYLMVYRKKSHHLIDWNMKQYSNHIIEESKVLGEFESSNVWRIDPSFDKKHAAVFPKELCDRVIQYYSYKNDLVFDPFGGSGTFGESALKNERHYFLTEVDPNYFDRIKEKLEPFHCKKSYFNLKEFKKWILKEN